MLDDGHLDRLVWCRGRRLGLAEQRVVPTKWPGLGPLRLALSVRVFDDDAHPVCAVVVSEIAHQPHARMRHLDDRGDALRRAQPQDRHVRRRRDGIAVERDDAKHVTGQRQAADFGRTGIQHVEQHALSLLHADRVAMAEHLAVDAEEFVACLEALGCSLLSSSAAFPDLLQRFERCAGEHVHRHVAAAAE